MTIMTRSDINSNIINQITVIFISYFSFREEKSFWNFSQRINFKPCSPQVMYNFVLHYLPLPIIILRRAINFVTKKNGFIS